jgi:hypothetical protein
VQRLETFDFWYVKIIDSYLHTILLSQMFDMALLCSHQILHQKDIGYKIFYAGYYNVSYYMSIIIMSLVSFELLTFWLNLKQFSLKNIEEYRSKEKTALKLVEDNLDSITKNEADMWKLKI